MPEVLIIEDEGVIREAIERLLGRNGMRTTGVESVEKALAIGALHDFDLILADVRLPGRSGLDIIAQAAGVPVVIMTSYASIPAAVDAMRRGAADYIAKPFDNEALCSSVETALQTNPHNSAAPTLNLSLAEYFKAFVRAHEAQLTETELARRLGLSRKALWERRQKFGLERQRQAG